MIAIEQSRPQIDLPCQTPARADVTSQLQRFLCGCKQMRRCPRGNLIARKQSIEMRDVTVLSFRRLKIPIFEPFLQLTSLANLHWRQTSTDVGEPEAELSVDPQCLCGVETLKE